LASRRKEVIDDYIQRILKNDPQLLEIHLDNQQVDDYDVIDICEALKENHLVKVLDFSGNPNIVGSSMDAVCELLERTQTLEQLLFHGCPIEHDKVLQMIKSLQLNRSLIQCTSGDNETETDIEQIESIMDRNYNSSV